jgi:cobalt-zinc-cadmium efflux system outer membrane protein
MLVIPSLRPLSLWKKSCVFLSLLGVATIVLWLPAHAAKPLPPTKVTANISVIETFQTLTLEQALTFANNNSPKAKAIKAQAASGNAAILTAEARLNPSLMSDNGVAENTYRLGVEQVFELGGKRQKRIAVAKAQQAVLLSTIQLQLLALRTQTRQAYAEAYTAKARQQALNSIVTNTQTLLRISQQREQAGDVALLDVLQTDIELANAQNELQSAIVAVQQAQTKLNALLNLPLNTTLNLTLPTTITTMPSVEQLQLQALEHRPEWQHLQQQLLVTERELALAKANRTPNLRLTGGFDKTTGEGGKQSVFAMGSLELPLLNRQQGPIAEALAKQTQLLAEQTALQQQLLLEVTAAHNAWHASQQRLELYETNLLPKVTTIMEKSRRSFEVGKAPIVTAIHAQQALANTQLGYLQVVQALQSAIGQVEEAIGTSL